MDASTTLLHAAWDRHIVREFCDIACIPSIWDSLVLDTDGKCIGSFSDGFKVNQQYIDGKKKADAMFAEIMADPEKIKRVVDAHIEDLKERRIAELEAELSSLKEEGEETKVKFGKPIVPTQDMRELLQLCVEWYAIPGNEVGGKLHIILDDDNVDDDYLLWCRERTNDAKAIAILDGLQKLSVMQRKWVTYNIYNVKEGEGEREVLEEEEGFEEE